MSPHRLALAGILVFFLAGASATTVAFAAPAPNKDSSYVSPIVTRAMKDLDTYQGQCWPWVQRVVEETTGRKLGFDYRQGYFDAGAVEVNPSEAVSGDVIQIANDRYTAPDADYEGLHTFIITKNLGDGSFDGIDSNQNYDGVVHLRSAYRPGDKIKQYPGLNYHIYRFPVPGAPKPSGTVTSTTTQRALRAGDRAIVTAQGDGLNLRSGAGTDHAAIGRLPDGMTVTVTSPAPVSATGREWVAISSPAGDGWVASEYLKLLQSGAPASASGPARPLLLYRAYIPVIATGND